VCAFSARALFKILMPYSELQRQDLALFDNLSIVNGVEIAARIAVDVFASHSCSRCMHIVVRKNDTKTSVA
jgi:hypothetical protein